MENIEKNPDFKTGNYKITIITVTYNSAETIEQTISSVVDQTYDNVEYIIIDGQSSDGTVDIIKKYESSHIKWISEPDDGIYDAMNKGVSLATGDYIEIIGSDDCLMSSNVIESVIPYLEDAPDILSCGIVSVDEKTCKERYFGNNFARQKDRYNGYMIPHPGMFVKRDLYKKYPFDTSLKIVSDYKFFLQCYYDNSVAFKFIDMPVVYFSLNGTSANKTECYEEEYRVFRELNLPLQPPGQGPGIKNQIKRILSAIGIFELVQHSYYHLFKMKKHHCQNRICRWCNRTNIS